MAWIEFHPDELVDSQKFQDFRSDLRWSENETLGFLGLFWAKVLKLRDSGDITGWKPDYVARLTRARAQPEQLMEALRLHRWIDDDNGNTRIHNWIDFAGRFLEARYRTGNPERLREIWSMYGKTWDKVPGRKNPPGWDRTRREILERDDSTCRYCGVREEGYMEVDHVVPASKGGSDEKSNLVACCRTCNRKKSNKPVESLTKAIPPTEPTEPDQTKPTGPERPADFSDPGRSAGEKMGDSLIEATLFSKPWHFMGDHHMKRTGDLPPDYCQWALRNLQKLSAEERLACEMVVARAKKA